MGVTSLLTVNERLHARVLDGVLIRGHTLCDDSDELQSLSGDATQVSLSSSTPPNLQLY